jgi:predicted Rossmann fold flavoprotein
MPATKHYDVIIIGAGAAGLMCAIEAGKRKRHVLILEKSSKPGRKILISGGGRCNFTNLYTEPSAYLSNNPHFCKSALSRYTQWDFIALLEQHGITWHEKKLGQLFCDQKAGAVLDVLLKECQLHDVDLQVKQYIHKITRKSTFEIPTQEQQLSCESLVIATGGPSIPRMGSTDFGLRIAKQFGLKNIPFHAGLVPFTFPQTVLDSLFNDLSGVSLDVEASCNQASFRENMLFTHRGLSGPAILQLSSYWKKGDTISISLLPDLDVAKWLKQQQIQSPKAKLKTILSHPLPRRFVEKFCQTYLENKPMNQLSDKELEAIATLLTQWQLKPSGTEGMRTAEVSLGGVDTHELSSKTFQAQNTSGLYFIGETIDVTGHLGGYNFQWAWSSGWCAGQFV